MAGFTQLARVTLVIGRVAPPSGHMEVAGETVRFDGWLDLLTALERVLHALPPPRAAHE